MITQKQPFRVAFAVVHLQERKCSTNIFYHYLLNAERYILRTSPMKTVIDAMIVKASSIAFVRSASAIEYPCADKIAIAIGTRESRRPFTVSDRFPDPVDDLSIFI